MKKEEEKMTNQENVKVIESDGSNLVWGIWPNESEVYPQLFRVPDYEATYNDGIIQLSDGKEVKLTKEMLRSCSKEKINELHSMVEDITDPDEVFELVMKDFNMLESEKPYLEKLIYDDNFKVTDLLRLDENDGFWKFLRKYNFRIGVAEDVWIGFKITWFENVRVADASDYSDYIKN